MNGTIFDLKRFAVHDGQGLRTTLFLKGCPLRCPWCQNPEGLDSKPMVWLLASKCIGCQSCVQVCPEQAIAEAGHIDYTRCTACSACVQVCPAGAMELVGKTVSSEEAAQMLLRDRVFYEDGGGVTLSGGEVLLQWQFARDVLTICHDAGIDTAIETSLFAPRAVIEQFLDVTDHFIVDIKLLNSGIHKDIIGVDNTQILENYRFLVEKGADILVRTPLIPGYTDSRENIQAIAQFVYQTDPCAKYELLNFNPLCRSKYQALDRPYPITGDPLSQEQIQQLYGIAEQVGLRKYKE